MTNSEFTPGLTLATGSEGAAQEWVGETGVTYFAHEPVNSAMIRLYASMVEDGYPAYWRRDLAERIWGGVPSPPGMLTVWRRPLLWRPDERSAEEQELFARIPFPAEKDTILTVSVDTTFERQVFENEWLNWRDRITDITEEKATDLGRGHFITGETVYCNQQGERVATNTKTIFRYASNEVDDGPETEGPFAEGRRNVTVKESPGVARTDDSLSVDDVSEGEQVPPYQFPVSYEKVIYDVAATRDFYPGHNDPEFARAQGNDTIFLNNIAFQGLVDRLALEWAGPEWRVLDRSIRIQGAAPAGSLLTVDGEVTGITKEDNVDKIEIDGQIRKNESKDICPCSITIAKGEK